MASSPRSRQEMVDELTALVRSVVHPQLRKVLKTVFGDRQLYDRFLQCPGAQSYHHSYLGGLLEHSVAVASHCARLSGAYASVNRDLLVSAALLHDIGKLEELSYETGIEYTDAGRLIGHVVLGVQLIRERGVGAGIDSRLLEQLEHVVLSHHGELEWGSPKRPSTIEALLLHHVDNLDAKVAGFAQVLGGASTVEESWTDAGNLFRRPLFAPRAAEDDRPIRTDEDSQHCRMTA